MRISCIAVATFALATVSLAAPVKRGFLGAIQGIATGIGNVVNSNATLSGITGTVVQSIENPKLTAARLTVVKALADTQASISQINNQATATNNSGVNTLVAAGQAGLTSARQGVDSIGKSLVSGAKPLVADQKTVAVGIKAVRDAVNKMAAAITTPDQTLSRDIATAQTNTQTLQNGGQDVLSASGLSFASLGLPDNFATS